MDMDDLLRKTLEKQALRGSISGRGGRGRGRGGNSSKSDKKLGGRSLHLSFLINDGLLKPGIVLNFNRVQLPVFIQFYR